MSSRAMAAAKNRRTSPYSNGTQTSQPPQPLNKTMSASQRMSQIQGQSQGTPQSQGMPQRQVAPRVQGGGVRSRQRGAPPLPKPVPQPVHFEPTRPVENVNSNRKELSIPEAFAMLNRKLSIVEEILQDNGVEFETHNTTSGNIDEKLGKIRREMEDAIRRIPDMNTINMQVKLVKDEKDNEIALLKTAIHDITEEFREFRDRFDHEEISITAVGYDGSIANTINGEDMTVDNSIGTDTDVGDNIEMEINDIGTNQDNEEGSIEGGEKRDANVTSSLSPLYLTPALNSTPLEDM